MPWVFLSITDSWGLTILPREQARREGKWELNTAECSAEHLIWGKILLPFHWEKTKLWCPRALQLQDSQWKTSSERVSSLPSCCSSIANVVLRIFSLLSFLLFFWGWRCLLVQWEQTGLSVLASVLGELSMHLNPSGNLSKLRQRMLRWALCCQVFGRACSLLWMRFYWQCPPPFNIFVHALW